MCGGSRNFACIHGAIYYFRCISVCNRCTARTRGAFLTKLNFGKLSFAKQETPKGKPTAAKGTKIGRPRVTVDEVPPIFLRHYPAYKAEKLNISELARVCELSRTTVYKYLQMLR